MEKSRILYFILGVLVVTSIGAVSVHNDGIEFPDGSFQKTAGGFTAATAVQGTVSMAISGAPAFCTPFQTLYTVPANMRLVIEWISVETAIFGGGGGFHPVEFNILTWDGGDNIFHPLARLESPLSVGASLFSSDRWQGAVRLYSEAGQPAQVSLCFDAEFGSNQTVGRVTFSGYLIGLGP